MFTNLDRYYKNPFAAAKSIYNKTINGVTASFQNIKQQFVFPTTAPLIAEPIVEEQTIEITEEDEIAFHHKTAYLYVHKINMLDRPAHWDNVHPARHVGRSRTRVLDIMKASERELLQARCDLNNDSIKQAFNKNHIDLRGQLHALILNQLQKIRYPNPRGPWIIPPPLNIPSTSQENIMDNQTPNDFLAGAQQNMLDATKVTEPDQNSSLKKQMESNMIGPFIDEAAKQATVQLDSPI